MQIAKLNKTQIKCTYSIYSRVEDTDVRQMAAHPIVFPLYIPSDVFRVICKHENEVVHDQLHENIDYKNVMKSKSIKEENEDQLSVIIFGIDSMSRLAAIRSMPKSLKFIRDELGAYIFEGYNKVGENTFPNIIPLL